MLCDWRCAGIHEVVAHEVRVDWLLTGYTLQEMLKDTVRTETYMQAMLKNKHLFKDKVISVASPS